MTISILNELWRGSRQSIDHDVVGGESLGAKNAMELKMREAFTYVNGS